METDRYVLYRENPNTHHEEYLETMYPQPACTYDVDKALAFATAAEGYEFGGLYEPKLDWWRVGKR